MKHGWNEDWYYAAPFREEWKTLAGPAEPLAQVRLPHGGALLPQNSFSEEQYQELSGYVKWFDAPQEWRGRRVFVCFEGAAHEAHVYCNGELVGEHHCGYTAFRIELTQSLRIGETNNLTVRLDSRESLDIPPFGGVIDYMTFRGLYREVFLEVTDAARIADMFVRADAAGHMLCAVETEHAERMSLTAELYDPDGALCASATVEAQDAEPELYVENVRRWSCETPQLYRLELRLTDGGRTVDTETVRVGFRTAEFRADGFYLNGEKVRLRGLNRHQSWPYLGYAAPARAQRFDADILKYELGCNAVRTSHYPQSRHFIDRCDELGLLVFTEIPGWQHIGGDAWKWQAVRNTEEMVRQYRNHPSVILWGVRINESADDDTLYAETNRTAHELDPSRPTSGVRYIKKSHLLEDVYAYNDFVHCGTNRGCDTKKSVTPDISKPYLISEYNGHMFPTKPGDDEAHRLAHALRHARVLSDAAQEPGIAGTFGWCMFDYNTHRDFGSGDRVCYHGVLDMFRNPKLAAAVYAAQGNHGVLAVSSSMDIGEHPAGAIGTFAVFTDADEVRLYKNDEFVGSYTPSGEYPGLAHPPVLISDTIGVMLEENEGFTHRKASLVKDVLYAVARFGPAGLSPSVLAKAAWLMTAGHMTYDDMQRLFYRYVGSWGGEVVHWRFDAVKDGQVIASRICGPGEETVLHAEADSVQLCDGDSWDMATVRMSARNEYGAVQTYCSRAVRLKAEGAVELVGPEAVPLAGGMAGCYVRTKGVAGEGILTAEMDGAPPVTVRFTVTRGEEHT